jgi:cobalt-precorrin-5B (C1)-methyltransferase
MPSPRPGYTLPVFACASAVAALRYLQEGDCGETVAIDLIEPARVVAIPIEQVARIAAHTALAITRSEPGDNLDLTRHTPVWALVEVTQEEGEGKEITIQGGEGIGKQSGGQAAIYRYAQKLLRENLQRWQQPGTQVTVTIILPAGRKLAERTSNAAFGVVEGLSLLGTSGLAQPLSAPEQLAIYQEQLAEKVQQFDGVVFCIGENGLDLAQKMGINPARILKTANWLGPLLVGAGLEGMKEILLFGYHGKLIKLAGGIFHTHHHLADGRLAILTAHCAQVGLPASHLPTIFACPTAEAALQQLRELDGREGSHWVAEVYRAIATAIDRRTQAYIRQHAAREVTVGSVLFDRDRAILVQSQEGAKLLARYLDFRF